MARGIERRTIFHDTEDAENLLCRLEKLVDQESLIIYAWAILPNHFHILVRSTLVPLSRAMRSLMTGYAGDFNRRYNRSGHVFQNRFKSILCEEDPYFLELVRYIHLNPLRAGVVKNLSELEKYPGSGHSGIMGYVKRPWQTVEAVLKQFSKNTSNLSSGGKNALVCRARAALAHLWLNRLGNNGKDLSRELNMKPVTLYNAAKRGREHEDADEWEKWL